MTGLSQSAALLVAGLLGCTRAQEGNAPPAGRAGPATSAHAAEPPPPRDAAVARPAEEPASAQSPGVPTGSDREFREALDEARRASRGGDRAAAAAAFDRVLALRPDDPRALCEGGWAQFEAGGVVRARDLLDRGARALRNVAGQGTLLAACSYNLGRVLEQAGERDAAASAYRESIALRANAEATARLDALGSPAASVATSSRMSATLDAALQSVNQSEEFPPTLVPAGETPDSVGEYTVLRSRPLGDGPVPRAVVVSIYSGGTLDCAVVCLCLELQSGWECEDETLAMPCGASGPAGPFELRALEPLAGPATGPLRFFVDYSGSNGVDRRQGHMAVFEVGPDGATELADLLIAEGLCGRTQDADAPCQITREWSANARWEGLTLDVVATEGRVPPWLPGRHSFASVVQLARQHPASGR